MSAWRYLVSANLSGAGGETTCITQEQLGDLLAASCEGLASPEAFQQCLAAQGPGETYEEVAARIAEEQTGTVPPADQPAAGDVDIIYDDGARTLSNDAGEVFDSVTITYCNGEMLTASPAPSVYSLEDNVAEATATVGGITEIFDTSVSSTCATDDTAGNGATAPADGGMAGDDMVDGGMSELPSTGGPALLLPIAGLALMGLGGLIWRRRLG